LSDNLNPDVEKGRCMKLLFPLDGSHIADRALDAVPMLARVEPVVVRLVSVVEAQEGLTQVVEDERLSRERSLLRSYLDTTTDRLLRDYKTAAVDSVLLAGDPVDQILSQEAAFGPDLLVIGTHGRSGISRWRLGSVADSVIRRTKADTLVVGPGARIHEPVRGILVGLDGSELAERALPQAIRLADAFDAALHIVRVISMTVTVSEDYYANEFEMLQEFAAGYLDDIRRKIEFKGELVTASRIGGPADRLMDYAAAHDIDLVVMTSHGRGGLGRTLMGSVAGRMAGGPLPVWIVKVGEQG
jgi:nucleotide-binding universal stress UspA family protein